MCMFISIVNIIVSIIICILSLLYTIASHDKYRKIEKLITFINYIVVIFLITRRFIFFSPFVFCIESSIIILLINFILLGNLIDNFAGLKKINSNTKQTILYKIKGMLWNLTK